MVLVGAGDADAYATLYDRYSHSAYSLARKLTGEKQAAEDLAQDALIKVWRSAGSYRAERGGVLYLDPLRGPQPLHRPPSCPGKSPQDAGEVRGPPARAKPGPRARALLRSDARRDSRAPPPAARHREGTPEARAGEAAQQLRASGDSVGIALPLLVPKRPRSGPAMQCVRPATGPGKPAKRRRRQSVS